MSDIERSSRFVTDPLPAVPPDADVFIVVHDRQRDIWLVGTPDTEQTRFEHVTDDDAVYERDHRRGDRLVSGRSLGIRFSSVMEAGSAVSTWIKFEDVLNILKRASGPRVGRRGIGPG